MTGNKKSINLHENVYMHIKHSEILFIITFTRYIDSDLVKGDNKDVVYMSV